MSIGFSRKTLLQTDSRETVPETLRGTTAGIGRELSLLYRRGDKRKRLSLKSQERSRSSIPAGWEGDSNLEECGDAENWAEGSLAEPGIEPGVLESDVRHQATHGFLAIPDRTAGSVYGAEAAPPSPPPHMGLPPDGGRIEGLVLALGLLAASVTARRRSEARQLAYGDVVGEVQAAWAARGDVLIRQRGAAEEEERERQLRAASRLKSAAEKASTQEKERRGRESALAEAAAKEAAAVRAATEAARAEFEAREREMRAELEARTAVERRILEEAAEKARLAEEQRRREVAAARQRAAEERARQEEEERQREAAAAAARAEEIRQRRAAEKKFSLRLEGSVTVSRPPQGTMTGERIPRPATLQVEVVLGSTLGGVGDPIGEPYASFDAARGGALLVGGRAAFVAADKYESAVRLQNMLGQGPLQDMGPTELRHFARTAAVRAAALTASTVASLLASAAGGSGSGGGRGEARRAALPPTRAVEARTQRGVLPQGHEKRGDALLSRAVASVESGDAAVARSILGEMMAEEEAGISEGLGADVPAHCGEALMLAHFLDHTWAERPARQAEASPWYQDAVALTRTLLRDATRGAPKDSLSPTAELLGVVLGPAHPIAQQLQELAEANLSAASKQARLDEQRRLQAELAARLVREEWPDRAEIAAASAAQREANTPIPERVWALKNVGATLALGGPGERGRARIMYERAVLLKEQWAGGPRHPSTLPELQALAGVLDLEPEWAGDAAGVRSRLLSILTDVTQRYVGCGRPADGVAVLEDAVRATERELGVRHPAVSAASRLAERLFDTLTPEQRERVVELRGEAGLLDKVANAFTETVAAQQLPQGKSKAALYDEGGLAPLPVLT